jgi:hypothetical protein
VISVWRAAYVFAVEPTEHEGRAKDNLLDTGGGVESFLRFLGFGVVVDGKGVDDGGGDADGIGDVVAEGGFDEAFGGGDVVANILVKKESADLGVADDEMSAAFEFVLPGAGLGEVGLDDAEAGMQLSEEGSVCRVLVDGNQLVEVFTFETRNQILADETCSTCDHNFFC